MTAPTNLCKHCDRWVKLTSKYGECELLGEIRNRNTRRRPCFRARDVRDEHNVATKKGA